MNDTDEADATSAPDLERAARIKRLRAARGLTQKQLATELGVSERAYQGWELGANISGPSLDVLARGLDSTPLYIREGRVSQEQQLGDLIDKLAKLIADVGLDRRAGPMRGDFQSVAELISSQSAEIARLQSQMEQVLLAVLELRRGQAVQAPPDTDAGSPRSPRAKRKPPATG